MTMNYYFTQTILWPDVAVVIAGSLYAILPMEDINDYVFSIKGN
jgi:hypothetical protein